MDRVMNVDIGIYDPNQLPVKIGSNDQEVETKLDSNTKQMNVNMSQKNTNLDSDIKEQNTNVEISFDFSGKGSKTVYTNNVLFNEDVICAGEYTQVGNVTKGKDESKVIPMKGKTLADFIRMIFTKEIQPKKTEPSVTATLTNYGSYEVGNSITPKYSCNFNPGSYTYGPATGVTIKEWLVKDSNGDESTSQSGTFNSILVGDATNYIIEASVSHTEGAVALTNLGYPSIPEIKIEAGTKKAVSNAITGYRSIFYGPVETGSDVILKSDDIRSLTFGMSYISSRSIVIYAKDVPKAKRFIVAIPSNSLRAGVTKVLLTSAFDTDITGQYKRHYKMVNVEGANGYISIPYDVWVYEPASIDVGEVHTITLG